MLSHGLLRHQFTQRRIAAAARAKHCGAESDFVERIVVEEGHHRQTSFKKKGTKSSLPKMVGGSALTHRLRPQRECDTDLSATQEQSRTRYLEKPHLSASAGSG